MGRSLRQSPKGAVAPWATRTWAPARTFHASLPPIPMDVSEAERIRTAEAPMWDEVGRFGESYLITLSPSVGAEVYKSLR
jgi:hypothetical protein